MSFKKQCIIHTGIKTHTDSTQRWRTANYDNTVISRQKTCKSELVSCECERMLTHEESADSIITRDKSPSLNRSGPLIHLQEMLNNITYVLVTVEITGGGADEQTSLESLSPWPGYLLRSSFWHWNRRGHFFPAAHSLDTRSVWSGSIPTQATASWKTRAYTQGEGAVTVIALGCCVHPRKVLASVCGLLLCQNCTPK